MRSFNIKKLAGIAALGFAIVSAGAVSSNAQTWRQSEKDRQRIIKQQQKIAKQNAKREQERLRRERRDDRGYTTGTVFGNNGRIGSMREATNSGYQQGLQAGQYDRRKHRYNQSNVYRDSTWHGDPTGWDYYYRQGYLQGYQAGYNGSY
jgi:hypothetical protein